MRPDIETTKTKTAEKTGIPNKARAILKRMDELAVYYEAAQKKNREELEQIIQDARRLDSGLQAEKVRRKRMAALLDKVARD